jgi:hypothetical protein
VEFQWRIENNILRHVKCFDAYTATSISLCLSGRSIIEIVKSIGAETAESVSPRLVRRSTCVPANGMLVLAADGVF